MSLLPHQQRVVDEKEQLDFKLAGLNAFLSTRTFDSLGKLEQGRMLRQAGFMSQYSAVLADRIRAFPQ